MSATHDSDDSVTVSVRIRTEDLEEFMQTLRSAQAEGIVPVDASRSEAIRRAMLAATDDPSILSEAGDE